MSDYTPERTGGAFAAGHELGRAFRDEPVASTLVALFYLALSAFGLFLAAKAIFYAVFGAAWVTAWVTEGHRDWRRASWIEDCATYSEIADCSRRYDELQRPLPKQRPR